MRYRRCKSRARKKKTQGSTERGEGSRENERLTNPGQRGLRLRRTQHKRRQPVQGHVHSSETDTEKQKSPGLVGTGRLNGRLRQESQRQSEKHRQKLNMKDPGPEIRPRSLRISDARKRLRPKSQKKDEREETGAWVGTPPSAPRLCSVNYCNLRWQETSLKGWVPC